MALDWPARVVEEGEGRRRRIQYDQAEGWWQRLEITREKESDLLRFIATTDRARAEETLATGQLRLADRFRSELRAAGLAVDSTISAGQAWLSNAKGDSIGRALARADRALYQAKFAQADQIFAGLQGYQAPDGGFFLWLPVDDGEQAALKLWRETGVRVLPGAYLSRDAGGQNPGKGYIRVALVAAAEETQRGLTQLRDCLYG